MWRDVVELESVSDHDLGEWRELAARALAPNPFFEPEYVLPLAKGLGATASVRLVVVRDSEGWQACVPVHVVSRWHRIRVRLSATWRGQALDGPLGTPLVSSDRPGESLAMLFDGMRRVDPRARFAAVELVGEDRGFDGPLTEGLSSISPEPLLFDRFTRAAAHRRPEPTYLDAGLSSSRRSELRRQRRRLGEALGGAVETVDCAGEDGASERFLALESAGWKGREGSALGSDPGHVAFFRELCRAFAGLGRLQLLELRCSGQTVAARCNLLGGDTIFGLKQAYDEAYSSYSPGMLLELDTFDRFHASGAAFFDSCANRNSPLGRIWPDRRQIATYAIPAVGLSGRAMKPILGAAQVMSSRRRASAVRNAMTAVPSGSANR